MLFYADCTPIMIVDPVQKGAALLHAGWRGTVGAIGPKAVSVMKETFHSQPRDLVAAIGPSIGPKDYEVDDRCVTRRLAMKRSLSRRGPITI